MLTIHTTLRRTKREELEGVEPRDVELMRQAEREHDPVRVLKQNMEGYYDIELQSGQQIKAVSWFHLDGCTREGFQAAA